MFVVVVVAVFFSCNNRKCMKQVVNCNILWHWGRTDTASGPFYIEFAQNAVRSICTHTLNVQINVERNIFCVRSVFSTYERSFEWIFGHVVSLGIQDTSLLLYDFSKAVLIFKNMCCSWIGCISVNRPSFNGSETAVWPKIWTFVSKKNCVSHLFRNGSLLE